VIAELIKERMFVVEQIETINSPKFSKHFFIIKRYSKKESVLTQGYFNGVDWCFENIDFANGVSTLKVVIPKEFQTLNPKTLTTSSHYLLILGFQDGSFQSLIGSFVSPLQPT
jgi:hypothetical protein